MFCKILSTNQELCRELVGLILGKKVSRIAYVHDQENIEITSDSKGVRLDVYLEDSNSVYDVEMQTVKDYYLGRRSRYYQGMIDLNLIGRGASYKELKQNFLNYIAGGKPIGDLPCRIEDNLTAARNKVGWRREYMTLEMRDREISKRCRL